MTDGDDDMPWRQYRHVDPRRGVTHLSAVIGRRGTALVLIGSIWVALGLSTLALDNIDHLPLTVGIAWIVTGTVAIMSAQRRQGHDAFGFLALYVMAAFRALTHLSDVVLWIVPDGRPGELQGIVGVLVWAAVIALIVLVSGWKEPEPDHPQATP